MLHPVFEEELKRSGYLHRPLPLHRERSLEAEMAKKKVIGSYPVYPGNGNPYLEGVGRMEEADAAEDARIGRIIILTGPVHQNGLSVGAEENGIARYRSIVRLKMNGEDLSSYQRIRFLVRPLVPGGRAVHLRCGYINEGPHPVPDVYGREGQHLMNLENGIWNEVIWECAMLPKDHVTSFWIKADVDGPDTASGDEFVFEFARIAFEQVEKPEQERGWFVQSGKIAYSMNGYLPGYPKTAVMEVQDTPVSGTFTLLNERDQIVYTGQIRQMTDLYHASRYGEDAPLYAVLDFSEFIQPGNYRLACGNVQSDIFEISENVLEEPVWKLLNFIFCERCGYPVPGKHGRCHTDVYARYKGMIIPYAGGWHDAGDLSQQSLQTAELSGILFELALRITPGDMLRERLMEEACWGLEQVLKTRLGDGVRASSVGIASWSEGWIGDSDDIEVRTHAQAFQNLFEASIEAQASAALKEYDPTLTCKCLEAAKEDYEFGKARFEEYGIEYPILWEHTLNSSLSLYYAAALMACSDILLADQQMTEREKTFYQQEASFWAEKLLSCQETGRGAVKPPLTGFFYRDESHQTIVHFNHQGRDHLFVEALMKACEAMPEHPKRASWEEGMRLYADYLKALRLYASPYGMLPAGLHHISETQDEKTFKILHLLCEYEKEKEHYQNQLHAGIDLGDGYYLRQFPVWFSFRGNSAIHLGMGRAAALLGNWFKDPELTYIAMDQLSWTMGKNPFAQSLIYGVGHRYTAQDANFLGETTGEVPVGIETLEDEDIPYWPAGTSSTYKEVWLTAAGRILSIVAGL